MGAQALLVFTAVFFLSVNSLSAGQISSSNYFEDEDLTLDVYTDFDSNQDIQLHEIVKRDTCIPKGGICDNLPNECCEFTSCRCNLWGYNCRCQRIGLFQK